MDHSVVGNGEPRPPVHSDPSVNRRRKAIAARLQRFAALWQTWELVRALTAIRPADAPYVVELIRSILRVRRYTAGGPRLVNLFRLSRVAVLHAHERGIEGAIVECGVAAGGTSTLMAMATRAWSAPMYLFDTFAGLPAPGEQDGAEAPAFVGTCFGSQEQVRWLLQRGCVPEARARLVPGLFDQTLAQSETGPIALLHLDCDWYASVKVCLDTLYDRVFAGGYVVIDDYGFWPGARKAVDEFRARRGITAPMTRADVGPWFWRV